MTNVCRKAQNDEENVRKQLLEEERKFRSRKQKRLEVMMEQESAEFEYIAQSMIQTSIGVLKSGPQIPDPICIFAYPFS